MTTLSDLGITVKPGVYTTTCPKCSADRKPENRRKPCLSVNNTDPENALFNCHNCSFRGRLSNYAKYEKVRESSGQPKEQALVYGKEVSELLSKKQISPSTAAKFGCYERIIFNKTIFCLPYFENSLVNVKFRKTKYRPDEDKFWLLTKEKHGAKLVYFGMHLLDLEASKEVTIVEGEFDAMTHYQAGRMNIISVPNGAPDPSQKNLDKRLEYATDPYIVAILAKAEKIYLFTDNDGPGKYLRDLLASIYGKKRCYVVSYPTGYKDSNEVYAGDIDKGLDPLGKSGIDKMYELARPYPISGVLPINNPVILDDLQLIMSGGFNKGLFTGCDHYDDYFRVREKILLGLTGIPSHGKSLVYRDYSVQLCKNNPGLKLAGFTPEMRPPAREYAKIIENYTGKTIVPNRHNSISRAEFESAVNFIHKHYLLINPDINGFTDVFGKDTKPESSTPKGLKGVLQYFKYLKDIFGISGFWIDAWNKLDHQRPKGVNAEEFISQQLDYLLEFLDRENLFAIIIAHPTKMVTGRGSNIIKPTLYDIKGSSAWYEKLDIGLVAHRTLYKRTDKKDENGDEVWKLDNDAPTILSVDKMKFDELGEMGSVSLYLDKSNGSRMITEANKVNSYEAKKEKAKKKVVLTSSVPNTTAPLSPQTEADDEFISPPF